MTQRTINIIAVVAFILWTLACLTGVVEAEDCPNGTPSCKIVVMTPEEINTLTQPGGIFDQSIWANRSGMTGIVEAWKKKIETSPSGTVKAAEPKQ